LQEYKTCANKLFPLSKTDVTFEVLDAVNALHFMEPERLRDMMVEGPLSTLPRQEVLKYIKLRSDFKNAWVQQYRLLDE